jgi:glycosyltransferase involved in cell wall biosynthesis
MKILYLHQYFVTPDEYGATRSYWFAKKLIQKGFEVTIISSLSSTTKRDPGIHYVDGIKVIYIGGRYSNIQSKFKKIFHFLRYFFIALSTSLKEKNVDLIYATSTPLTVGAIALLLKKINKTKYVFEVRDLWPEFPIQIGVLTNSYIIKILRRLEHTIYQEAEEIIALSPGMKDGVLKTGVIDSKVTVIPNMSKPDLFYPRVKDVQIMTNFNIKSDVLNILHFGSMGVANGLEYIIEVAKVLKVREISDIKFLFAGYGQTEEKLKKLVNENELENIDFLGKHNTYIISELINCCEFSFVSFKNLEVLYTNSPNKLFDSLSAGKPVIVNSAGWTKDLVENNNCGFFVNPENPLDFVDKIQEIKNNRQLIKIMGENARILSLNVFDKEILSEKFANLILKRINKYV